MSTVITLRPGVLFCPRSASIEFDGGRRLDRVTMLGTVRGSIGPDRPIPVHVLSAVYPVSPEQIARRERLPALAVVPVETHFLHADRDILFSLFQLPFAVDVELPLNPSSTIVLPMHGSVEMDENGRLLGGGCPCLRVNGIDTWATLDAGSVATLIRWIRGPAGERACALINLGCYSSTPEHRAGMSFNEELATLLAGDGVAVYGPPHGGVVTAATWYSAFKKQFGQQVDKAGALVDVPIRFCRIRPVFREKAATPAPFKSYPSDPCVAGTVVITNDCALAIDLAGYSPDFAMERPHEFDRALME